MENESVEKSNVQVGLLAAPFPVPHLDLGFMRSVITGKLGFPLKINAMDEPGDGGRKESLFWFLLFH